MKKLLLSCMMLLGLVSSINATEIKTPILLNVGNNGGVTITPLEGSTTEQLYGATFTVSGDLQNIFQYKPLDISISDELIKENGLEEGAVYQKVVLKFAEAVSDNYQINDNSGFRSIQGQTEVTIDLDGNIDDFTIFSWFGCRGSITISECYFYYNDTPTKEITSINGFLESSLVTDLSTIENEAIPFMITKDGKLLAGTGAQGISMQDPTKLAGASFYGFQLETLSNGNYAFRCTNDLTKNNYYPGFWGADKIYLNTQNSTGNCCFVLGLNQDGAGLGEWTIEYEEGKGYAFKNVTNGGYFQGPSASAVSTTPVYYQLYTALDISSKTVKVFDYSNKNANEEIFSVENATNFNSDTRELTNGGWNFRTPVNISNYKYIVITTTNNASDASHEISITDNTEYCVKGDIYSGSAAGTGGNMWLDRWNNQNVIAINTNYLYETLGVDVENITALSISGTVGIANIYLTNKETKFGGNAKGVVSRSFTENEKFGTICLPFTASVSGARVYSIASGNEYGISLTEVNGLLEAGKPYFYMTSDVNGQDNSKSNFSVNFFRADANDDVAEPIENNGLIGTFSDNGNVPAGAYVLSNNKLYEVDSDIPFAANKAYVDITKVQNVAEGKAIIEFGDAEDATAVKGIEAAKTLKNAKFYDLSGREVSAPTRGLYIVNGKKVLVK